MEENEKSYHEVDKIEKINPVSAASKTENEEESEQKKNSRCKFPTAYTILLIIEIIVFFLTYIIPKGKFNTIEYSNGKFTIKYPNETEEVLNATEKVLEEKGINIPLENFVKGYIKNLYPFLILIKNYLMTILLFLIYFYIQS